MKTIIEALNESEAHAVMSWVEHFANSVRRGLEFEDTKLSLNSDWPGAAYRDIRTADDDDYDLATEIREAMRRVDGNHPLIRWLTIGRIVDSLLDAEARRRRTPRESKAKSSKMPPWVRRFLALRILEITSKKGRSREQAASAAMSEALASITRLQDAGLLRDFERWFRPEVKSIVRMLDRGRYFGDK